MSEEQTLDTALSRGVVVKNVERIHWLEGGYSDEEVRPLRRASLP